MRNLISITQLRQSNFDILNDNNLNAIKGGKKSGKKSYKKSGKKKSNKYSTPVCGCPPPPPPPCGCGTYSAPTPPYYGGCKW